MFSSVVIGAAGGFMLLDVVPEDPEVTGERLADRTALAVSGSVSTQITSMAMAMFSSGSSSRTAL
jgi:hypothetical protein